MKALEDIGKVFETDVLVVGGGMAGLPAALRAREEGAEVLLVEKGFTGLAGQAPRGGNGILALPEDADYDEYEKFVCTIGDYLNDQDALDKYARMINSELVKLHNWGATLSTYDNGDLAIFPFEGSPMYNTGINLFALDDLRKAAVKIGVKMENHTFITRLIKVGDQVCGAVGFDIYDGTFKIFKAKSVVVCCGANAYRATRMFTGNGEGNILSFDVGAQMRDPEFNFIEVGAASTGETIHNSYMHIKNQNGENVWNKYVHWNAQDVCPELIEGIEKEIREGRGPVYVDMEEMRNDPAYISMAKGTLDGPAKLFGDKLDWNEILQKKESEYIELSDTPALTFSIHGNTGFVRVDKDMHTTVKGLYQAGADTGLGSAIHGAAPLPAGQRGGSFMYCAVTGDIAGTNAAIEGKDVVIPEIPAELVEELKAATYHGYKENTDSGITPRGLFDRIQDAACDINVIFRKSEETLTDALEKIKGMKKDFEKITANDWHELKLVHEADSLIRTSEISITCGLARKETRNFHRRVEFPERDDENWLKWTLADNKDGEIAVSFEDVPIDTYKFKPEKHV